MNNARALESNYANDNFFKLTFSWPWVIKALLSVDTDMCCRLVNSGTWGSRWRRLQIISERVIGTERVKNKWTNEEREKTEQQDGRKNTQRIETECSAVKYINHFKEIERKEKDGQETGLQITKECDVFYFN